MIYKRTREKSERTRNWKREGALAGPTRRRSVLIIPHDLRSHGPPPLCTERAFLSHSKDLSRLEVKLKEK